MQRECRASDAHDRLANLLAPVDALVHARYFVEGVHAPDLDVQGSAVDPNDVEALMRLADRHVVLGKRRVGWTEISKQLRAAQEVHEP